MMSLYTDKLELLASKLGLTIEQLKHIFIAKGPTHLVTLFLLICLMCLIFYAFFRIIKYINFLNTEKMTYGITEEKLTAHIAIIMLCVILFFMLPIFNSNLKDYVLYRNDKDSYGTIKMIEEVKEMRLDDRK